jgi:hypothetical protein
MAFRYYAHQYGASEDRIREAHHGNRDGQFEISMEELELGCSPEM